ncbi:MAG: YdeI/OmpD-associated family protein [Bacteroidota bacterium]
MSAPTQHAFPAPVLRDPETEAGYMRHYVPIPVQVADELDALGVTHVEGTLDAGSGACSFRRALHRQPSGALRLKFGEGWLRDAGAVVGTIVHLELRKDPDPSRVDVPDELATVLAQDAAAFEAWSQLSPSRQKTYAYHVRRAKQSSTRVRRALSVVGEIVV